MGAALALACLVHAGPDGLTDFELAAMSGKAQTSIGVRRKELCRMGLVEGTTRTRPAPSGSPAAVWVATRAGIAYDEAQ